MKHLRWAALAAVAGIVLLFVSCGGNGGSSPNPTPIIQQIFPSSITAGSDGFTLFISGTGFVSSSKGVSFAYWNGSARSTNFDATTGQLAVSILKSDVANPGIAQVNVINPEPGGGPASSALSFKIQPLQVGAPAISSFDPATATAGGQAFTLTVNGSNFAVGDFVTWDGGQRITTFVDTTQLTAAIDPVNIAKPGFPSISVGTPNPVIASRSLAYSVTGPNNPMPSATSLTPSSATAGAADLEVLVKGSGFVSGSVVEWDSVALATAFRSSSQLVALIPAANLAASGSASITVTSPAPGGGTSTSPLTFTVN
ncbi:MAG TPA: hypothetical protein VNM68_09025 [Candidatus Polarisedimenticolia bacterium]|nr:hypothetical protein [Candidatus Polarisedimenticolia bacterium]